MTALVLRVSVRGWISRAAKHRTSSVGWDNGVAHEYRELLRSCNRFPDLFLFRYDVVTERRLLTGFMRWLTGVDGRRIEWVLPGEIGQSFTCNKQARNFT
jgi:hypothetical protein